MTHHLYHPFFFQKLHTNQDQLVLGFFVSFYLFLVFFMGKLEQGGQYQIL